MDEKFTDAEMDGMSGMLAMRDRVVRASGLKNPTPREFVQFSGRGRVHDPVVGGPKEVCDRLEQWFVERGCDGFVVSAAYVPGVTMPSEVMLTIGWNVLSHLELEPAHCGDENCEADHGYLGTITADDFSLRVSQAADGEDAVRQLLSFARELSDATAVRGG